VTEFSAALRRPKDPRNLEVVNAFNQGRIEAFRSQRRPLMDTTVRGSLLLTVRGSKTGRERTVPLAYARSGADYLIVASVGGRDTHPDWYHNVKANPDDLRIELGDEVFRARARITMGAEYDRLFQEFTASNPGFKDYQRNTSRVLPVIALTRIPIDPDDHDGTGLR
jgi:deazaflavin-dependent oxidoreductase (nitroreductase family)